MRFFNKRTSANETPWVQTPSIGLGSGRLLRSDLQTADCINTFVDLLKSYEPPPGEVESKLAKYMAPYVAVEWDWAGPAQRGPAVVFAVHDNTQEVLFAAFWLSEDGTKIAVFPLGVGDDRLSALSIIGDWKQLDPSLSSIGVVPTDQVVIKPPHMNDEYVTKILEDSGFPLTLDNVAAVGGTVWRMFLGKAQQLIASKDPKAADRFVKDHDIEIRSFRESYQGILDDLSRWDPVVLLYIQDLPMRIRAMALLVIDETGTIGGDTLERG